MESQRTSSKVPARSLAVFAEKSVLDLPEFLEAAKRYPDYEVIDDYQTFRRADLLQEKKCVIFSRKRGPWVKPFHCYDNPQYNYFSLDLAEGCRFDCVYCYLQSYLNHGALVVFLGWQSLQEELNGLAGRNAWISTGLLSDSLLAEGAFPVMPLVSKWIPQGAVMEMRSKSGDLRCMEDPEIDRDRIVLSWSLNPAKIASRYEYKAASLDERLRAIARALSMGYRIGLHLDPVFYYAGWEEEYSELFEKIREFPKESIAFVSIGLFRYMPDLGNIIRQRFPFHPILSGEFFVDRDGKYHYFRGIRKQMYRTFQEWLKPWNESVPVFISMEPD